MASKFWQHYDTIMIGKDYDAEVAAVLPLLKDAKTLLEIGCGTGEHTKRFAPHFQGMCALDMDEDAIEVARKKKAANVVLIHSRIEDFHGLGFGGAVALFNVVHYQQTEFWLNAFMRAVARRLKPGGTFVFDCWNCEAALADPPKSSHEGGVKREAVLDYETRLVEMTMTCDIGGDHFVHWIYHKLWTIEELSAALGAAGFVNIRVAPWMMPSMRLADAPIAKCWKIMFICERSA